MTRLDPSVFVHERALCETTDVGPRTRIWAFAHVMPGARVGADCNVGDHAFIESGVVVGDRVTIKNGVAIWDKVTLEDEVFVGPNAVFTNDRAPRAAIKRPPADFLPTVVRRGASIGANATIVCGVTLGTHCLVGAGAVVTRDVPAHALMAGNPARRTAWVCACGEKLAKDLACRCGRGHRLIDAHRGLEATGAEPAVRNRP
jgi:acetyltransferase-like isoleucine patch superfamily enzyme